MINGVLYIISFEVKPEKEAELRELINDLIESTRLEKGVSNYHWAKQGAIYHSLEHFADNKSALKHLQNFGEIFAERYMSLGTVLSTTVYGNPSADVRDILDGFGAAYLETVADVH
ncbi:hypothetical protein GIX45_15850 [Erwinia sp. CPCC 100877]|nr:hypothetical protein [Erwinia sp. CPCC 100877]